jgi:hypothetical protein
MTPSLPHNVRSQPRVRQRPPLGLSYPGTGHGHLCSWRASQARQPRLSHDGTDGTFSLVAVRWSTPPSSEWQRGAGGASVARGARGTKGTEKGEQRRAKKSAASSCGL